MDVLLYLIGAVFVLYLFFALLPFLLPLILIIIIAFFAIMMYLKHKVQKEMKQYEDDFSKNDRDENYKTYTFQSKTSDEDIIDVEFTESDQ